MTEATSAAGAAKQPLVMPEAGPSRTRRAAGFIGGVAARAVAAATVSGIAYAIAHKLGQTKYFNLASLQGRGTLAAVGVVGYSVSEIAARGIVGKVKSAKANRAAAERDAKIQNERQKFAKGVLSRRATLRPVSVRIGQELKALQNEVAEQKGEVTDLRRKLRAANSKLREANSKLRAITDKASASRWGLSKAEVARLVS